MKRIFVIVFIPMLAGAELRPENRQWKISQVRRWQISAECEGITVGTKAIPTDRESQAKITAAYQAALVTTNQSVLCDLGGNLMEFSTSEIAEIATAVSAHVQQTLATQRRLEALISSSSTAADLREIKWHASQEEFKPSEFKNPD